MKDKHLCQHVTTVSRAMQDYMETKLRNLKAVHEIRVCGLMIGIELKENCTELVKKALDKGLVINVTKHRTIRLLPPLICEEKDLLAIVDIIEELITENYE
jgi:acetylornithine aminotransferase